MLYTYALGWRANVWELQKKKMEVTFPRPNF